MTHAEIDALVAERTRLRLAGSYAEADAIRVSLFGMGIVVEDGLFTMSGERISDWRTADPAERALA